MPDELIGQSVMQSLGFDGETLRALAPGEAASFLGFQVPKDDLGKGIRSFRRGMGSLIWALRGNLQERVELRLSSPVAHVEPDGQGARVQLQGGESIDADAVLVATNAVGAAHVLGDAIGEPARALSAAPTLSSVTVELAFMRDALDHPLDATGFVVALDAQRHGLRACTFTSAKFIDRAPPGRFSVRLFFRPEPAELHGESALDDDAWSARALEGLARTIRVQGEPLWSRVSRWPDALPVFNDAHRGAVATLEAALAGMPLLLAGSAFHGSGIDAAVRSGEAAAATLRQRLG
jgi:oxygen-dependent protoporphyrinogen oxidase